MNADVKNVLSEAGATEEKCAFLTLDQRLLAMLIAEVRRPLKAREEANDFEREAARHMMPWNHPTLAGWSIVGMNHYWMSGARRLFVAMTRGGRCIRAEGVDEAAVFASLVEQAERGQGDEHG